MSKIRIYELAKQLNVANKDLMEKIHSVGIEAKIAEMLDNRLSESDEDLIDDLGLDMNEIIESMNRKAKDFPNESNET